MTLEPSHARHVAYAAGVAAAGGRTTTIYAGREALRRVRAVDGEGRCEVLCGATWRAGYVEPFGLGKIFVGAGSRLARPRSPLRRR